MTNSRFNDKTMVNKASGESITAGEAVVMVLLSALSASFESADFVAGLFDGAARSPNTGEDLGVIRCLLEEVQDITSVPGAPFWFTEVESLLVSGLAERHFNLGD